MDLPSYFRGWTTPFAAFNFENKFSVFISRMNLLVCESKKGAGPQGPLIGFWSGKRFASGLSFTALVTAVQNFAFFFDMVCSLDKFLGVTQTRLLERIFVVTSFLLRTLKFCETTKHVQFVCI